MVGHSMNAGMRKRGGMSRTKKNGGAMYKKGGGMKYGGGMHKKGGMKYGCAMDKKGGGMKYGGGMHKKGGMSCSRPNRTKKNRTMKNKREEPAKKGSKGPKSLKHTGGRKQTGGRKHTGGRKGCAMATAKGFQSLLHPSDTIQGLEAQAKTIQQQKVMAAKGYSDDRQSMKRALARDIQKPGMEVKNALRLQAAYGTPQKALAGFGPSTWYRA
jgi:hypothetical protein